MASSPQAAAGRAGTGAALPQRPGEHFAGFGVMGLPFDSGHYLALRRFPANTIGAPYHSVWHRAPDGEWVFYGDTPPVNSCARYFDAALAHTEVTRIGLHWPAPDRLEITVDGVLDWTVQMRRTPATAATTRLGRMLPGWRRTWRAPRQLSNGPRRPPTMYGPG